MPITVVVVRDDNGAPATREVYADGARYRHGTAGLEIISVAARQLGLYPDGNWLSVYIDDVVAVESTSTAASVHRRLDLSTSSGGVQGMAARTDVESGDASSAPSSDEAQGYAALERVADDPVADDPVADDPVAFADPPPDDVDAPGVADPAASLPSGRQVVTAAPTERPAGLRPVTFRRALRAGPRSPDAQPSPAGQRQHSQLRPLVFRPRAVGRPNADTAPEDGDA